MPTSPRPRPDQTIAGTVHPAVSWDGPAPGGHHASGTLSFPGLGAETRSFRLVLKDLYGVPERIFEWQLP